MLSHEQFRLPGMPDDSPSTRDPIIHDDPEPPADYYQGPGGRQLVFPGMEMTPEQHVKALGTALGFNAHLTDTEAWHGIELHHPEQDPKVAAPPLARLEWAKNDTWEAPAGEIGMVDVHKDLRRQGIASAMLFTAEALAHENPENVSLPRHSAVRSTAGKAWSRAKMEERGETVW